jgi:hypothetical protein
MSPERVAREVAVRRSALKKPKADIHPDDVATRDVMDALTKHPDAASDPRVLRFLDDYAELQRGRSVERHSERTRTDQTTPDPDDARARFLGIARAEDIRTPEERIYAELLNEGGQPLTRHVPEAGVDARKAIRNEAAKLRRAVGEMEKQSRAERRAGNEEKADELEAFAHVSTARAETLERVVNRERRAKALEKQAKRAENPQEAARLRKEARELMRQAHEAERRRAQEFAEEAARTAKEKGYRDPIYFRQLDVTNKGALNVMGDYPGSQIPKKELRNMGKLAREGRIDEAGATLLENAFRGRVTLEMRTHVKTFLAERLLRIGGEKLRTGPQWRRSKRMGRFLRARR